MGTTAQTSSGPNTIGPANIASYFGGFARNKVINGDFVVAGRGTSFSTPSNGAYTLDRWLTEYDGSIGSFTLSQQIHTPGAVTDEPANFLRWNQTAAGSGSTVRNLVHRIEDVRQLAGKAAALTFWAKADSGRSVSIDPRQNFGGGGSGEVTITPVSGGTLSLTTSWQQFKMQCNVPSIAGKTIGTDSFFRLIFNLPINTTMMIDISHVQLEESDSTPFEQRPVDLERKLCEYFYRTMPVFVPTDPTIVNVNMPVMRKAPTIAGGGAGFASANVSTTGFTCKQTAAAVQTLTLDAEL